MHVLENTPKIKVFEALGCIADMRVEIKGNQAKIFSSSRNKYYTVSYDGNKRIMSNDNGSYWVGYLGYPAIAFLMIAGKIRYNKDFAEALKGIFWKDVNTTFKNNYAKTENYVFELAEKNGVSQTDLEAEAENILSQIKVLKLEKFGKRISPPNGY